MAVNTKEICRRVNGNVSRDFCHSINGTLKLTAKSYSEKRGCATAHYADIPCKVKFLQMRSVLFKMEKTGEVRSFRDKGLDLKKMGKHKVVSTDTYRFWIINEKSCPRNHLLGKSCANNPNPDIWECFPNKRPKTCPKVVALNSGNETK